MMRCKGAIISMSLIAGCIDTTGEPEHGETAIAAAVQNSQMTTNAVGKSETATTQGEINPSPSNAFFKSFGTNGRTCGTCHAEVAGWSITPALAQSKPANDPLFVFDGSDCLPPGVANPNPTANSKQMRAKGNVRIDIGIPSTADFSLVSYVDPLGCPTPPSAANLRMYRRPLPSVNNAFLSTVMWDGRENKTAPNNTVSQIVANLRIQANDATLGHAQATQSLSSANIDNIVIFDTTLFQAQKKVGNLNLDTGGVHGGAAYMATDVLPGFQIGVNDVLGCGIPNSCAPGFTPAPFTSTIFTLYAAWEPGGNPPNATAAAIGRGERIFNTKSFTIDNVGGLNRNPGDPVGGPITGFCGSCHDTPNIGNHSTSLPIDIGITAASPVGGLDVAMLPKYTFRKNGTTEEVTVTDPGRALITGKFADIGKTKGPILRGLASRAPYFHNGGAADLMAVVNFYNARFNIGLTAQEKSDLVAFMNAL